jgi:high-affinity iron transporter
LFSREPELLFAATLMTWFIAVHILDDVSRRMSALAVQAATGLLAIFVLFLVMNWFFLGYR